jgi:hypothetical protein
MSKRLTEDPNILRDNRMMRRRKEGRKEGRKERTGER